jgi:Domain of unknown function (DUF4920)
MKNRKSLLMLLAAFALIGVVSAHEPAPTADSDARQFGDAVPVDVAAQSLTEAVSAYSAEAGDQAISGRVGQVCQKAGCWMTLTDGDAMARVMTDHKFALPKELSGQVVVFGKLEAIDLDEKEVAHMAKDSGKPATEIAPREYRIAARGVAVR